MDQSTQEGDSIHDRILKTLEPIQEPIDETPIVEDEQSTQSEPEETEESDEVSEETSEETEVSEDEEQEESTDDVQTESESLTTTDLSKALGFDDDALDLDEEGNVLIKTKIDGQEGKAKLKDLVVSYQLRGHLDKQNMEVAEIKKSLQTQTAQIQQETSEKLNQLESMLQVAWAELDQESDSPALQELREADPAEWTARQRELELRKNRLAQSYQTVQAEKQAESQKSTQLNQTKVIEHLQEEDQKLMKSIDGWDDQDVAKKGLDEVFSYLKTEHSFNDEDLYGVRDAQGNFTKLGVTNHKAIVLARKAMLYDKLQKTKPTITKKVKAAPKIVKPGQPKGQDTAQTKILNLKKAVKDTGGKKGSVAEYLLATGKV